MEFSRQEYWSGLPFPTPGDLPDSGSPALIDRFLITEPKYAKGGAALLMHEKTINLNESESCSIVSNPLQPHGLYSPWNSPGQNTGVGSLSLLQGIFSTQGLNPGLLHCRQILYQLSYQGSPRILEWVTYPFSSRSSWPSNWTRISCIVGRFFMLMHGDF